MKLSPMAVGVVELLPPQRLAVEALLHGRNVLACLPTGLGKSMIFQILPSCLAKSGLSTFSVDPIVVIASPLIALMRKQVSGLQRKNLKAGMIGESLSVDENIKEGRTTFVYGSPEVLVGNSMWREVLKTQTWSSSCCC